MGGTATALNNKESSREQTRNKPSNKKIEVDRKTKRLTNKQKNTTEKYRYIYLKLFSINQSLGC